MALPTDPKTGREILTFWTEEATDEDVAEFFALIDGSKFRELYLQDWSGQIARDIDAEKAELVWDRRTGRYVPNRRSPPAAPTSP